MKCFFKHKWEITQTGPGMIHVGPNAFTQYEWDEDVQIVIETCSKCGKEKAYLEKNNGSKKTLAVWKAKQYTSPVE